MVPIPSSIRFNFFGTTQPAVALNAAGGTFSQIPVAFSSTMTSYANQPHSSMAVIPATGDISHFTANFGGDARFSASVSTPSAILYRHDISGEASRRVTPSQKVHIDPSRALIAETSLTGGLFLFDDEAGEVQPGVWSGRPIFLRFGRSPSHRFDGPISSSPHLLERIPLVPGFLFASPDDTRGPVDEDLEPWMRVCGDEGPWKMTIPFAEIPAYCPAGGEIAEDDAAAAERLAKVSQQCSVAARRDINAVTVRGIEDLRPGIVHKFVLVRLGSGAFELRAANADFVQHPSLALQRMFWGDDAVDETVMGAGRIVRGEGNTVTVAFDSRNFPLHPSSGRFFAAHPDALRDDYGIVLDSDPRADVCMQIIEATLGNSAAAIETVDALR